jgi:2-C-methyl-D-erythritol 4-phosphate cytidylyltransferase
MNKYAVIVAGGMGTRMGGDMPKQFLPLNGKPVLYYTIRTFTDTFTDLKTILVLPAVHLETGNELINEYFSKKNIRVIAGGETRFQSVKNGLSLVEEESIVFVHDGVRCLLSEQLIRRCYDMAFAAGSAIPVITSRDSVRLLKENNSEVIDRDKVMLIQTPQTFHSKILLPAFQIDYKEKFTDEATVVEAYGIKVSLVEGEEDNIKITRPIDMLVAEKILSGR